MMPVTLQLKQWREERGLSQAALAQRVGVRQATINDLENGHSGRIEFSLLDRLCAALDIEPGELLARAPRRRKR